MNVRKVGLMPPSSERDQLDHTFLNERITHLQGLLKSENLSLTSRIREINSISSFREIIKRCFNNNNFVGKVSKLSLSDKTLEKIREIHSIDPQLAGLFFEHLIFLLINKQSSCNWKNQLLSGRQLRKIIIEKNPFSIITDQIYDHKYFYDLFEFVYTGEEKVLITKKTSKFKYFYLQTNKNYYLEKTQKFTIKETGHEWFLINTYSSFGDGHFVSGYINKNKAKYKHYKLPENNIWIKIMESSEYLKENTEMLVDFKSRLIETIGDEIEWAREIYELCSCLVHEKSNIYINQGCKGKIPASCDLIIDDLLIDIKCTKDKNENYCILQLLGYAGLLYHGSLGINIEKIANLNLLRGEYIEYDISEITDKQLEQFLGILDPNSLEPLHEQQECPNATTPQQSSSSQEAQESACVPQPPRSSNPSQENP